MEDCYPAIPWAGFTCFIASQLQAVLCRCSFWCSGAGSIGGRGPRPSACVTSVFLAAQIAIGALALARGFSTVLTGLHVATASAVWAGAVVTTVFAAQARSNPTAVDLNSLAPERTSLGDYLEVTKPAIVGLLLATTLAAMVVAADGWPGFRLMGWTLLGGALAAGGSSALNQVIDRHLDGRMQRTSSRPLPTGRMSWYEVLAFGLVLCVASFYIFALLVNLLSALLALVGILYYVLFYSLVLKQRTAQNIVIGGGAGAVPPLVGWAAASGTVNMGAFFLFALIFFWTPPHFWALALVRRHDYKRAGVPMLPVVYGEHPTRHMILLYTLQVVALTLLLPLVQIGGWIYFLTALALGVGLVGQALRLWRVGGNRLAWGMYRFSSMYLALILGALVVDTLVLG